jgi:hypothetical protein
MVWLLSEFGSGPFFEAQGGLKVRLDTGTRLAEGRA